MLTLSRATANDIRLNQPLPFSIYDRTGRLLLRAGTIIAFESARDALVSRGAYYHLEERQAGAMAAVEDNADANRPQPLEPVFDRVQHACIALKSVYSAFQETPDKIDFIQRIEKIALILQGACQEDSDAAIAALHLFQDAPYLVLHQALAAIIVETIGRQTALSIDERLPIVCAALCYDVSMFAIHSELESCKGPLTEGQRSKINDHPTASVNILKACGLNEDTWLNAVVEHHERGDGSGYPEKKTADDITLGGKILAIADMYSAMIRPRPYRASGYSPQNALRNIYLEKDAKLDGELVHKTIRGIGIVPPGTLVKLRNNEVAVVKTRPESPTAMTVFSLYNSGGMPLLTPLKRETSDPTFAIAGRVSLEECRSAELIMRRLWAN